MSTNKLTVFALIVFVSFHFICMSGCVRISDKKQQQYVGVEENDPKSYSQWKIRYNDL